MLPPDSSRRLSEYVVVVKLVDRFMPMHSTPDKLHFLSDRLERNHEVAMKAGKIFANAHNLFFEEDVCSLDKPILTVFKQGEYWFPTELYPDVAGMMTHLEGKPIKWDSAKAVEYAKLIASKKGTEFVPYTADVTSLGAYEK